jgi:hypothetical protein
MEGGRGNGIVGCSAKGGRGIPPVGCPSGGGIVGCSAGGGGGIVGCGGITGVGTGGVGTGGVGTGCGGDASKKLVREDEGEYQVVSEMVEGRPRVVAAGAA